MRHVSRNIAARGVVNGWGWIPQSRAAPIPRGDSAPRFGAAIRCGDSVPPRSIATFAPGRRGEGAKGRRGEGAKGRRGEGAKGRRGEGATNCAGATRIVAVL